MATAARAALAVDGDGESEAAEARAIGLRYVDCNQPGLRRRPTGKRLRVGKRWVRQFVIEDQQGRVVRDRETLERIRRLAIPPAWDEVWICPIPDGHVQATGRDARRRKQYRYHPRWRALREGSKYGRMIALGQALPGLRRRIAADLARPGLPREKVLATVARLLETTFIRVGNEEYVRANRSFGLTTLEDRHVDVRGDRPGEVRFHFRGKSGVYHEVSVRDPKIARIVQRCRALPGQELFQYVDDAGEPAAIDSADVNAYIREAAGDAFTAKDFRTWAGSVLALAALREEGAADRRRPNKAHVGRAIARVAQQLRNTPAVCRKSYVHPEVIGAFLDGALQVGRPRRQGKRVRGGGLAPIESSLLALLRRREREERKGTRLAHQLRRSLRLVR